MLNLLVLMCAAAMAQGEVLSKSLTFPDENKANNKCSAYTKTWTAKMGDDSWTVANFNNNNWGWTYIKCGSKSAASVASISTDNAIADAIIKVVLDVKSTTVKSVNSVKLTVASDPDFEDVTETVTGDLGSNTTFSGDLTFNISSPAKNLYYRVDVDCPKTSANGVFSLNSVKYYSGTSDVNTTLTFGEDIDGKTFVVRQGDTFAAYVASVTPSDAKGSISYASSDDEIAAVDPTTGVLSLGTKLGKAVITATFTPEEGYVGSTASYTIDQRQAVNPKNILFDETEGAFDGLDNLGYKDGDYELTDLNGDTYTFALHNVMHNYYGHGLQLKKAAATDETSQGTFTSPVFDKFEYGYRLTVKYEEGHGVEISCPNYPTEVAVMDDGVGTAYVDIPYADGVFCIAGGTQVSYVQSIELSPLDKPAAETLMSFPEEQYTVYQGEQFAGVKATITNELGAEISGLPIIYTSDNENVAVVDENTGDVVLGDEIGQATIKAYFIGNADYKASEASYTINVVAKPEKQEPGFYYEESTLQVSLTTGQLTTTSLWFRNPNNINVKFASSNEDVATVDEEGTVTLVGVGEVTITASFDGDDNYKEGQSSCNLVVTDYRNETTLSFAQDVYTVNMATTGWWRDVEAQCNYAVTDITYTSSNPEVAEESEIPNCFKLVGVGETTITATFAGNGYFKPATASYKLVVVNEPVDGISGIEADKLSDTDRIYNLQGQRVAAAQAKKGVYVVNGKKVVVK